jgi:hypothetical protein
MLYVAIALLLYISVILTIFLDDLKHISRHIVDLKISMSDLIKMNNKNYSEIINKIEEKNNYAIEDKLSSIDRNLEAAKEHLAEIKKYKN